MIKTDPEKILPITVPEVKGDPGLVASSLKQKPLRPTAGKPIIGAGGIKPFRAPPPGTKSKSFVPRFRKPLRATMHTGK